jgi:hypothetical protein
MQLHKSANLCCATIGKYAMVDVCGEKIYNVYVALCRMTNPEFFKTFVASFPIHLPPPPPHPPPNPFRHSGLALVTSGRKKNSPVK